MQDSTSSRVHVDLQINIRSQGKVLAGVPQTLALYGPGDIIGIDRRAVIKTEPRSGISAFETNYLPYIEFYDEDFPWRYTPAAPNGNRLRPWLALIVLRDSEFEHLGLTNARLPAIRFNSRLNAKPLSSARANVGMGTCIRQ